jgi:hypothetical protein
MCDAQHQEGALMRTTLAIDDDILAAARHIADRDQKSVVEVVSALARQGLARGSRAAGAERNGVPLLPSRRGSIPVTPELVNQLRDELP